MSNTQLFLLINLHRPMSAPHSSLWADISVDFLLFIFVSLLLFLHLHQPDQFNQRLTRTSSFLSPASRDSSWFASGPWVTSTSLRHTQPCCQEGVELHTEMFYRSQRWAVNAYLHGLADDVHFHRTTRAFWFLSRSDGKSQRAGTSWVDYKRRCKSHERNLLERQSQLIWITEKKHMSI